MPKKTNNNNDVLSSIAEQKIETSKKNTIPNETLKKALQENLAKRKKSTKNRLMTSKK